MATKLFESIIVGPIHSRRLGNSLGINLLPQKGKICNFDCIYCECGWNKERKLDTTLPTKDEVKEALEKRLKEIKKESIKVDSITFSGNGEPTIHPQFAEIVDITAQLRREYIPQAKISVLSNSTMLYKKNVFEALKRIDNPILKIDSALEDYIKAINNPNKEYSITKTIEYLKEFNGNFILQTMFLKGVIGDGDNKIAIDCTNKENVEKWRKLVEYLQPRKIMMYTLDRDTPAKDLHKVSTTQMEEIAKPLQDKGFDIQING